LRNEKASFVEFITKVFDILASLTKHREDPILTAIVKSTQLIVENEHNLNVSMSDMKDTFVSTKEL
jgi:hypothetical protein